MFFIVALLFSVHAEIMQDGSHHINSVQDVGYQAGINFLGWSTNGQFYAFEKIHPDEGAVSCPYTMTLEIVDAKTDRWVKGSGFSLTDTQIGLDTPCQFATRQDMHTAFRKTIQPMLKTWSIEVGHLTPSLPFTEKQTNQTFTVNEQPYTVSFRSEDGYETAWNGRGNGYFLSWETPKHIPIEKGKRREYVYGYNLHSVFVSPNHSHVAFIVSKRRQYHEGMGTDFMSNGSRIPQLDKPIPSTTVLKP